MFLFFWNLIWSILDERIRTENYTQKPFNNVCVCAYVFQANLFVTFSLTASPQSHFRKTTCLRVFYYLVIWRSFHSTNHDSATFRITSSSNKLKYTFSVFFLIYLRFILKLHLMPPGYIHQFYYNIFTPNILY